MNNLRNLSIKYNITINYRSFLLNIVTRRPYRRIPDLDSILTILKSTRNVTTRRHKNLTFLNTQSQNSARFRTTILLDFRRYNKKNIQVQRRASITINRQDNPNNANFFLKTYTRTINNINRFLMNIRRNLRKVIIRNNFNTVYIRRKFTIDPRKQRRIRRRDTAKLTNRMKTYRTILIRNHSHLNLLGRLISTTQALLQIGTYFLMRVLIPCRRKGINSRQRHMFLTVRNANFGITLLRIKLIIRSISLLNSINRSTFEDPMQGARRIANRGIQGKVNLKDAAGLTFRVIIQGSFRLSLILIKNIMNLRHILNLALRQEANPRDSLDTIVDTSYQGVNQDHKSAATKAATTYDRQGGRHNYHSTNGGTDSLIRERRICFFLCMSLDFRPSNKPSTIYLRSFQLFSFS